MNPHDQSFHTWLLSALCAAALVLGSLVLGYLFAAVENVGGH